MLEFYDEKGNKAVLAVWRPIAELPQVYKDTRRMFVVRGRAPMQYVGEYITDPYCVWLNKANTEYVRWPHKDIQPTEFMELPE